LLRQPVSVTLDPPVWSTSWAICSTGTPSSESSETKLCRSSRGNQSAASGPAAAARRRESRRTLAASSEPPVRVVRTRSWSARCEACRGSDGGLAVAVLAQGVDAAAGRVPVGAGGSVFTALLLVGVTGHGWARMATLRPWEW
jgi:hypothetical protein